MQGELSGLALELAAWGVSSDAVTALPWLDAPPRGALTQAYALLQALAALSSDGRITDLGRRMLALGTAPRLAAAVLRAPPELHSVMADLLALLEMRSPLRGAAARHDDFRARLAALHAWRDRRGNTAALQADSGALAALEQLSKGWRRRLAVHTAASGVPYATAVGELLLHAFPDRVAYRDQGSAWRYTLANGRGARLSESTALYGEPWLVVIELHLEAGDSLILAAAPLDVRVLERDYPQSFCRMHTTHWNEQRGAVEAFEEHRYAQIVLERRTIPVSAEEAVPALLAAIRSQGLQALPWSEATLRLRQRAPARLDAGAGFTCRNRCGLAR
jgi:ATP-dependent helicase HrpB